MDKVNDKYIRAKFGKDLSQENIDNIRNAMLKYGENYWWESKNPVEIAMYQVFEEILMTDFSLFHKGLEKLVGRPVWTHELGLNIEGIREEARLGINRLKTGMGVSYEQRDEAIIRSIKMLEDYCNKTGKKFLKLELKSPEKQKLPEESERDDNGIDQSGYDGWLNPKL
ncbi:MAG: hypothetical protein WC438_00030 [Candidatus Pacearchaeota archaeon]